MLAGAVLVVRVVGVERGGDGGVVGLHLVDVPRVIARAGRGLVNVWQREREREREKEGGGGGGGGKNREWEK